MRSRGAVNFFFIFSHDDEQIINRLDERRSEISEKYGSSLAIPTIDLTTIRAIDFYTYCCCDMLEDPEYFLFGDREKNQLPESVQSFNILTDRMHNEMLKRSTGMQIGERLRKARKESGLTGEEVVEHWRRQFNKDGQRSTITQATVSNYERGKTGAIKLIDLLRYSYIYGRVTTPDWIMFGCTYTELINNKKPPYASHDPIKVEMMLSGEKYLEQLRTLLILLSEGKCELCNKGAPFCDKNGNPYLMLKALSDGLSLEEMVVLCPNCIKRIEILQEKEVIELLKQKALKHSLADLYKNIQVG